ncbi:AAA family ATPase [Nisaea sediminum]|uniref:AAA family ATPase n=1 Tax=Nisaea sediminum TaxID=2775867 RepID=UPI0018673AEB|nr:AAA family ATPase [Nisaea sediminum]
MSGSPGFLVILGGLPGTGKSSIGRELAARMPAQYLRIDTIEGTLRRIRPELGDLRDSGYCIAYALAADNLRLGHSVIADSVNPIEITRSAWRDVAKQVDTDFIEIEIFCSSPDTHRRRVEERWRAHDGSGVPDWEAVRNRHYEPWDSATVRIDTADATPAACAETLIERLRTAQPTS